MMAWSIVGLFFLGVLALVLLGWALPLIAGIRRLRRHTGGMGLTVVGSVWGSLALCLLAFIVYGWVLMSDYSSVNEIEAFDPGTYEGETASIVVPFNGTSSLTLRNTTKGGRVELQTTNGTFIAPAGTYTLGSYTLSAQDETDQHWTAGTYLGRRGGKTIKLTAGGSEELKVGAPFAASVKVQKKTGNNVNLGFELVGCGGHSYVLHRARGSRRAPGFEAFDKSGKRVWSGSFAYG